MGMNLTSNNLYQVNIGDAFDVGVHILLMLLMHR